MLSAITFKHRGEGSTSGGDTHIGPFASFVILYTFRHLEATGTETYNGSAGRNSLELQKD